MTEDSGLLTQLFGNSQVLFTLQLLSQYVSLCFIFFLITYVVPPLLTKLTILLSLFLYTSSTLPSPRTLLSGPLSLVVVPFFDNPYKPLDIYVKSN